MIFLFTLDGAWHAKFQFENKNRGEKPPRNLANISAYKSSLLRAYNINGMKFERKKLTVKFVIGHKKISAQKP